ncbi:unnamed protein product [Prunus brigantina]
MIKAERTIKCMVKETADIGGARAPSEPQEILVGRGRVAGTVPSLKSESVVMGRLP